MKLIRLVVVSSFLLAGLNALAETAEDRWNNGGEKHKQRILEKFDTDGDGELSDAEKVAAEEAREAHKAEREAKKAERENMTDEEREALKAERQAKREEMKEQF